MTERYVTVTITLSVQMPVDDTTDMDEIPDRAAHEVDVDGWRDFMDEVSVGPVETET